MPTAPPNSDEIKRAIAQHPGEAEHWSFADDARWLEWIDSVGEEEVNRIVKAQQHLPAVARLKAALAQAQGRLVRRERPLEMLVACAVARVNLVYLGPPGTAKSLLVRTLAEALGVRNDDRPIAEEQQAVDEAMGKRERAAGDRRFFEYLLTRYTTPEELFGGADINVLMEGHVYARRTMGLLPQAEIAFLDEIFKANSAILNTLLSLTNERIFFNMGQAFRVKLAFVVGASNESPDAHELGALFDRFPIRVPCGPVPDDEIAEVVAKAEVLDAARLFRDGSVGGKKTGGRMACLNDIRLLAKVIACEALRGQDGEFPAQFSELFLKLRRDHRISDRTPGQVLRVCRALALLETDAKHQPMPSFAPRHLRPWGYVAAQYEGAERLQRQVQDHIGALESEAVELFA